MSGWADQFRKALAAQNEEALFFVSSFSSTAEALDGSASFETPEERSLADIALHTVGLRRLGRLIGDWSDYCESESPIERAMYWALLIQGDAMADSMILRSGTRTIGDHDVIAPSIPWLEQQVELGRYRVDFVLTARSRWGFTEYGDAKAVVECDGHDFHEKTRQQAQRDKSRDRALQGLGLDVLRFTGSEIWANPLKCAREAITHVQDAADGQVRERGDRGET